ncbi:ABC transporter ATP-binding protein [uncultured Martelella sp.]|uniref:ABC transporter ATP-binding protein n=1 Tax=uncultured Martelella sp. TaxID=392331 RepID=UPI0029C8512B|nr:ABC transporter ATP-binding protein [uncultured Martelella sp.]
MRAKTTEIRSDLQSLKRLWALAGPLRSRVAAGIVFRFLQSFSLGIGFAAAIRLVSAMTEPGFTPSPAWVWQITGLAALSLTGQVVFSYLSSANSWLSSFALGGELRLAMLGRLQQLPLGFHFSRNRGDTVTMLTSDMQMVESFMSDGLPRVAEAFGLPVAVLAFMAFQDGPVTLAAIVSIVLSMPLYFAISRYLAKTGLKRQDIQAEAAARMIEYVQGMPVIRAFNRVTRGTEDFRASLEDFRDLSLKMVAQLTLPLALFGMVLTLGVPLVIFAAGLRFATGAIGIETIIIALMLVYAIYSPLLGLTSLMELTRQADASLTRMDRVLTAEPLRETALPKQPDGFAIAFEDVGFGYGKGPVLKDIGFSVPERSMTAIVGPSGAGKSTILNLLPRFWDVNEGAIIIGGIDIRDMAPERLSELITVVFQDVYLFSGTIFDNIAFGRPDAVPADIEAAAKTAQAHDFIMALPDGYDTRVGEGGASLSGGERQRISIARAMLKDAPIVLLDEATAAIDPTNERALQKALAALVKGKTLIVVAHKLSTVREADQILVLDNGRIVERGDHDGLIENNGLYRRLWLSWTKAAHWRIGGHQTRPDNPED